MYVIWHTTSKISAILCEYTWISMMWPKTKSCYTNTIHLLASEAWFMKKTFRILAIIISISSSENNSLAHHVSKIPNQEKQCILTNYKACQPCCFGNTKHFYRRFQLQKFCSDSWEHFQGYPTLPKKERSIQTSVIPIIYDILSGRQEVPQGEKKSLIKHL